MDASLDTVHCHPILRLLILFLYPFCFQSNLHLFCAKVICMLHGHSAEIGKASLQLHEKSFAIAPCQLFVVPASWALDLINFNVLFSKFSLSMLLKYI